MFHQKMKWKLAGVIMFIIAVFVIAAPSVPGLPGSVQSRIDALQINLGLDLQGGLHLEYAMDLSGVPDDQKDEATDAVQAVVERRVNAFGVGEPIVQVASRGLKKFLIVELPGIKDIEQAKDVIKETPFLDFREERSLEEIDELLAPINEQAKRTAEEVLVRAIAGEDFSALAREFSLDPTAADSDGDLDFVKKGFLAEEIDAVLFDGELANGAVYPDVLETPNGMSVLKKTDARGDGDDMEVRSQIVFFPKASPQTFPDITYKETELSGKYLESANVDFGGSGSGVNEPIVSLVFNSDGARLFGELTKANLNKTIAIYVDNEIISAPVVQAEIRDGQAVINGNFTLEEAKTLAQRLNEGALPVPIELISQQSVEASLGYQALEESVKAGAIGLVFIVIYMVFFYRIFGLIAGGAIVVYTASIVALFKLSSAAPAGLSITLTLAGVAGLVLSIGMAVDANVLIFERIREELLRGRRLRHAVDEGFSRAWSAIRDGNVSTILTSLILMTIGTGFVKGFAVILIIGVLMSMFTAIVLVKVVMYFFASDWLEKRPWLIYRAPKNNSEKKEDA